MPTLVTIPKDALYLEANDLDDFANCSDRWATNGWLISKDVRKGVYYSVGLKDSKVMLLSYDNSAKELPVEPVVAPTEPGYDTRSDQEIAAETNQEQIV